MEKINSNNKNNNSNNNNPNNGNNTVNTPKVRQFSVRFVLGKEIQTQIHMEGVAPHEAIGLLEMAKDQLMNNLRSGTKNLFNMTTEK